MKTPELSIIIINFNTFALTSACIESIAAYTKGIDYEVILVDNASQECEPKLFKEKYPWIQLIESTQNLGFAKGNNLGLTQAKGEYILLLNSDTELINEAIPALVEKIRINSKIGALSARLIYPDGRIQPAANRFPSLRLELLELFRLNKLMSAEQRAKTFMGFFFDHLSEREVDWIWGTFFLTRLEVIQKLPNQKLPDDFFMYYEDVQWCYMIKKLGYTIVYDPRYPVIHHLSASSSSQGDAWSRNWKKMLLSTQNEITLLTQEKGKWYVYLLYAIRSLKYLTLRKKRFRQIALFYTQILWNRLDTASLKTLSKLEK
ncbi:MAG: glycosyltransferase family 2 protein [Microscillaceae bacterium]|nr:glycosyltransferase family 2 protein [Microscillaceae bacterium]